MTPVSVESFPVDFLPTLMMAMMKMTMLRSLPAFQTFQMREVH
jgi:hypothetical protein